MLEEELGRMNPDMSAIAAFQAKEAEYAQRLADLQAATAERDNVRRLLSCTVTHDCMPSTFNSRQTCRLPLRKGTT